MRTPTCAIASPTGARCVRSAPPPTTSRWWRGVWLTGLSSVTRTSGTWPARAPSSPPWAAATSTWVVSPSTSPCWPTAAARPTTCSPARPRRWPRSARCSARARSVLSRVSLSSRAMELRGRWGLVTGAARRIGRSIALALAGRGLNVIVHYNASADAAAATVREIEALGVRALALPADLGRADDVVRLAREAEARSGGVDVLVNNASNYLRAPFDELSEAIWDASLDVNLKAPFLLAWHLGRAMKARGRGRIVNLADWAGERPYADYLPYCVSKAGVICLTKALAKALAPAVQVNAVSPGPVLPPEDLTPSEREAIVRATPLHRFGTPEDVARCVRFLVDEADFTTGAVYPVDGGRLIA